MGILHRKIRRTGIIPTKIDVKTRGESMHSITIGLTI